MNKNKENYDTTPQKLSIAYFSMILNPHNGTHNGIV